MSLPKLIVTGEHQRTRRASRSSGSGASSSPAHSALASSAPNTPYLSARTEYTSDGLESLDGGDDDSISQLNTAPGIYIPSGSERSSMKCQDLLLSSLVECENQQRDKGFFPNSTFTTVLNEEVISQELRRYREFRRLGAANLDRLTRRICGDQPFKKIFALLVLVNKLPDIETFIIDNVTDSDLPLCKVSRPNTHLFGLGRQGSPRDALSCFASWGPSFIRSFEEWQWTVLAPTFEKGQRRDVKHVVLSHKQPLPFTKDSRLDLDSEDAQGGHSTVFKVEIHPDHHNFNTSVGRNDAGTSFAIKYLTSRDKDRFKQEVGQSHDIWALGCLYLEMIAWLLGGWKLVQEFERLRVAESVGPRPPGATEGTFFKVKSVSKDGVWEVVVMPAVKKFVKRLHRFPSCTEYLHQFLDLIEQEMLVIKPVDPTEKGRIHADALVFRLGSMHKLCRHA